MSGWDVTAGGFVLFGGFVVLVGSIAQAWGDLGKYQDFHAAPATDDVKAEAGAKAKKAHRALLPKAFKAFLSKQFTKVISKRKVKRFLAKKPSGWFAQFGQISLLILIAIWRPDPVSGPVSGPEAEQHRRAEQALHDAAGWSLILLGSFLAVVAGLIQLVLLSVGSH